MPSQSSALIHCGQFSNPLRRIPHLVAPRDDGPWQLMVQKSGYSNQLRLVIYPIIYRIFNGFLYIPSSKGFLNHQQYHQFNGHQFGGSFPFCQNCNGYLSNEGKMKSVMPCLEAQLQNIHSNTSTNILMLQSAHLSSQCAQSNCTVATNAGRLKAMRYTPWHFVQCKQEIPKIFLRLWECRGQQSNSEQCSKFEKTLLLLMIGKPPKLEQATIIRLYTPGTT